MSPQSSAANSGKSSIDWEERLIVALDVPSLDKAREIIDELGDEVKFYKVGLELFMQEKVIELITELKGKGKKVFVDLKFFDVPRTVGAAVELLAKLDVDFITVHAYSPTLLKTAVEASSGNDNTKILAVTVLTSMNDGDLKKLGIGQTVDKMTSTLAKRAKSEGCHGVIASGLEAKELRQEFKKSMIIVTPGIRPTGNSYHIKNDDQKRTVNVYQAFENKADYIVVGRPIINTRNHLKMAQKIKKDIKDYFEKQSSSKSPVKESGQAKSPTQSQ